MHNIIMTMKLKARLFTCRTIFTRAGRHNYADPDYSYTDEEMAAIEAHREHYKNFVDDLRGNRKERVRVKEHKQFNDDTNIGIKVCFYLKFECFALQNCVNRCFVNFVVSFIDF